MGHDSQTHIALLSWCARRIHALRSQEFHLDYEHNECSDSDCLSIPFLINIFTPSGLSDLQGDILHVSIVVCRGAPLCNSVGL